VLVVEVRVARRATASSSSSSDAAMRVRRQHVVSTIVGRLFIVLVVRITIRRVVFVTAVAQLEVVVVCVGLVVGIMHI
jgi:hypothetical protein